MDMTLVVMAAGLGSRYGGVKQIERLGPDGEILMEYAIYDALRAGFDRIVLIIKPQMLQDVRDLFGDRIEQRTGMRIDYAFQTPDRFTAARPELAQRSKPLGTVHAVLCARDVIRTPFAVINADDFYGRGAIDAIAAALPELHGAQDAAMVGYRLKNTVTEFGSVARGVCEIENGMLTGVTERTKIFKKGTDAEYTEDGERFFPLAGDTIVSMNLWGFSARVLDELWARMGAFLTEAMKTNPLKCEYFLPFVVNEQLADKSASVQVLPCEETWYGVTYREDLASVKEAVARMKAEGIYTEELWK